MTQTELADECWRRFYAIRVIADHAPVNMPGKKAKGDKWKSYTHHLLQDIDAMRLAAEAGILACGRRP